MTAFYMWRLMNMTFYGKSRVTPEVQRTSTNRRASMTVPLMAAGRRQRARRLAGHCPSCGTCRRALPRLRALAGAVVRLGRGRSGAGGRARRLHRVDADGLSVAIAIIGIMVARYFYHHKPEIPDAIEKRSSRCTRCSTTSGTWTRSTISCSSTAWARAAALLGRLRPQRGGWRRERRRLADALQLHGLHLVGHLDRRRRGALQLVLREDALLPGVHPADRARAGLRASSWWSGCWRSSGITWRGNHMDQHLLSIILLTPLAGLAVLLLIPGKQQGPDPHLGEPGRLRRVPDLAAAGLALPERARPAFSSKSAPTGFPRSARTITSASTASACCWSCSPR